MAGGDNSVQFIGLLELAIFGTLAGLVEAVSTQNVGFGLILVVGMIGEAYFFGRVFIHHKYIKYANDDTFNIYEYSGYGDREPVTYASNGTTEIITSEKTIAVLEKYRGKDEAKPSFNWWRVPFHNTAFDGQKGGFFIIGADMPPESLSPPIRGESSFAPIDGFMARTKIHDPACSVLGTIEKVNIVVKLTFKDRLLLLLKLEDPRQETRLETRTVKVLQHEYSDWRFIQRLKGIKITEPQWDSIGDFEAALQEIGQKEILIDARQRDREIRILKKTLNEYIKTNDEYDELEGDREPDMVIGSDKYPDGAVQSPKAGMNWKKLKIPIIALLIIVGITIASLAAAPYVQSGVTNNNQSACSPQVGLGYYPAVFTQSGLANTVTWEVNLAGYNNTHTTPTNDCLVFALHNGSYVFKIYPPVGYTAQPVTGTIKVNGTEVSQTILFVQKAGAITSSTSSTTTTGAPTTP